LRSNSTSGTDFGLLDKLSPSNKEDGTEKTSETKMLNTSVPLSKRSKLNFLSLRLKLVEMSKMRSTKQPLRKSMKLPNTQSSLKLLVRNPCKRSIGLKYGLSLRLLQLP